MLIEGEDKLAEAACRRVEERGSGDSPYYDPMDKK